MSNTEQKNNIKGFIEFWKGKGYEKGQSQTFWLQLLSDVLGVEEPSKFIEFEDQVHMDKATGFIDGYIPSTKVLIEQKSIEKDLRKGIRQSDGSLLTPFQQAKKYIAELPVSRHPKYVITCNFKSFLIYNMENPNSEPEEILLENLDKEYYRLQFIIDEENKNLKREMEISIQAGELVGKIYDEVLPLYKNPENEESLKSLNMLCVRLVFCLYAEDAGLFGKHGMFHDYLSKFSAEDLRRALIDLFVVLDTKEEDRDPYMKQELAQFPYVNGGLFAKEDIEIPMLNDKVRDLLLTRASEDFDWSDISPTIFGAVFESTLNPETRRSGGMHYTSIENIHKVIDPLFLDELRDELNEIVTIKTLKTRKERIREFQDKISKLKFLDPACGSGNFLTETYLALRRLENRGLEAIQGGQIGFGDGNISPIKVSIQQFYGIEINDFAVTVAKTALWIAEAQMMHETEEILRMNLQFLPLKSYANIVEGNALRIDWNDVVDKNELNYIMGNPPFVGARMMEQGGEQKQDIEELFGTIKDVQDLDYVTGWYKKAAEYIQSTNIEVGYVSTDSITCGTQVGILWSLLIEKYNIKINFAYKSFKWMNESRNKAQIYCVIIGFSIFYRKRKFLYSDSMKKECRNINPYLIDYDNVYIYSRTKPLCDIPEVVNGNMERGGVNLIITNEEKEDILKREPNIEKYIKPFYGSDEFLSGKKRWCIWLVGAPFSDIRNSKILMEKVEKVKEHRLNSKAKTTRQYANNPTVFAQRPQPEGVDWLVIPRVSAKGSYIPFGFMSGNDIASDKVHCMPNATLYHFGIIQSNVHMAWTRAISMRMGDGYSYSRDIVYNNFPWPTPTEEQKKKIEEQAKNILNERLKYQDLSIRQMYGTILPPELRTAHQKNDIAVMEAYGFDWRHMTESDCVAKLMEMYQKLVEKENS